jgi:uncharacterized membrane protein
MDKRLQIIGLMVVALVIGFLGYTIIETPKAAGGSVYVDSYSADLYLNGTFLEKFDYQVNDGRRYRILYKDWKVPLSFNALSQPYVELRDINPPGGTLPYAKDWQGLVRTFNSPNYMPGRASVYVGDIESLALENEAGCFRPDYFPQGSYKISYVYHIHPYIEKDTRYSHLNLQLADERLPYRQVAVTLHDPQGSLVQMYTHPPMNVAKEGTSWVIRGKRPENVPMVVEMLAQPAAFDYMGGFPRNVDNVEGQTTSANSGYYAIYVVSSYFLGIMRLLMLLFPLAIGLLYYLFGREMSFTVPSTLSYVPFKRPPWLVNLVFHGDAFNFDPEGFYATILDLARKGYLEVRSEGGLKILLLRSQGSSTDAYEDRVLDFLSRYSRDGVFDAEAFEDMIKSLRRGSTLGGSGAYGLEVLRETMNGLMRSPDKSAVDQFATNGRFYAAMLTSIAVLLAIASFLLFSMYGDLYPLFYPGFLASIVVVIESIPPLFAPSTLFGRWKDAFYKEKLEWDSFTKFLSDFAMLQKYAPEDLRIWKEWLVYGTALGIGAKVVKAMEQMNVYIPEARVVTYMSIYFVNVYGMTSSPSSGGSGDGAR